MNWFNRTLKFIIFLLKYEIKDLTKSLIINYIIIN